MLDRGIGIDASIGLTFAEQATLVSEVASIGYSSAWTPKRSRHPRRLSRLCPVVRGLFIVVASTAMKRRRGVLSCAPSWAMRLRGLAPPSSPAIAATSPAWA